MTRILHASGYGGNIYTIAFDEGASSLSVTSKASAGEAPTWSLKHPKRKPSPSPMYSPQPTLT